MTVWLILGLQAIGRQCPEYRKMAEIQKRMATHKSSTSLDPAWYFQIGAVLLESTYLLSPLKSWVTEQVNSVQFTIFSDSSISHNIPNCAQTSTERTTSIIGSRVIKAHTIA